MYAASYDLKAPITSIEGLAQALRTPAASPMATTILGLMQDSVGRFQRTIASLTNVSRLQQSQDAPATPMPLWALVEDICLDQQPLLAVSGSSVVVAPDSCLTILFAEKTYTRWSSTCLATPSSTATPAPAPGARGLPPQRGRGYGPRNYG